MIIMAQKFYFFFAVFFAGTAFLAGAFLAGAFLVTPLVQPFVEQAMLFSPFMVEC
ncbi:MAG: hypothetical protein WCI27_09970 [Candidatus Omnitrophota bacterium]